MAGEATQQERGDSWDGVVRREVAVDIRVLDEEARSVEVIASTEDLDSHGDVVKQYWDLERYKKNGPVLWNHNLSTMWGEGCAEDSLPIGRGEARVEGNKLIATCFIVKGSKEEEPFVDKLWRRIKQGAIKAVSVGFKPGQIVRLLTADGSTDHWELGSPDRPNELREISFVPMGSNPNAVAKSIAFEREHFARMAGIKTANAEGNAHMAMTEQELSTYNKALSDAKTTGERVVVLEKDLADEKKASAKLETDLTKATARATEAEGQLIEVSLKALVGVKIAPTELDDEIALAKEIGLKRVTDRLAKRPDMKILEPVKNGEKTVGQENTERPTVTEETGTDGSADLTKSALAAPTAA